MKLATHTALLTVAAFLLTATSPALGALVAHWSFDSDYSNVQGNSTLDGSAVSSGTGSVSITGATNRFPLITKFFNAGKFVLSQEGVVAPLSCELACHEPSAGVYPSDHFGVHARFELAPVARSAVPEAPREDPRPTVRSPA